MYTIFLIHYIGLAYFQQPIRAMQFNAAEHQKQSCFKSAFKSWKAAFLSFLKQLYLKQLQKAAQRSSSYAAQRSVCVNTPTCRCSAAPRSAAHHMLRLKATCIYSAAQRMCERTWKQSVWWWYGCVECCWRIQSQGGFVYCLHPFRVVHWDQSSWTWRL